jgi:acetolactate synthase-1/2/3 large subunit
VTGGELVARTLAAAGVRTVFTLVGGHTTPVVDACVDAGVRLVDVRHEEAAAHMAHAWARTTGEPGVALVTAGPGVTNTATAVAHAWSGGAPVVLLAGAPPLPQLDRGALHEIDQLGVMRPISKWAVRVHEAARLPEYVARALALAVVGRPGPVVLELPSDVLRDVAEPPDPWPGPPARPLGLAEDTAVAQAAALLDGAERPLLVAGSGVFWSRAWLELVALAERTGAALVTSHAARGVVPWSHPLHVPAARSLAFRRADVVVVVGSRLNFMLAYGRPPRWSPSARLIQVDVDPAAIGHNRPADVALLGDAGLVLVQLTSAAARREHESWLDELRSADAANRARLTAAAATDAVPIHPLRLCAALAGALEPDAYVAVDGGDILSFARQALPATAPGCWHDSGPFGCLGYGIAAAAAGKLAEPDRQAVALLGDGALGLGATELDTAARLGLELLVVVSTNGAWAIEATSQRAEFGRSVATRLEVRPYHRLAESLGCDGVEVRDPGELAAALARRPRGRPLLVNVLTDPEARSPDAERGLGLVPRDQALHH